MKFLYISGCKNLTTIDDCAFCNFSNLEKLEIWFTPNLTNIHENAFGSISSGKLYSKLTDFGISGSNISSVSEKLFDWSKADTLDLSTKGFNCDCSMAWLINDLKRLNSVFSKKVHFVQMNGIGAKGKCNSPPEFNGKHLYAVSGKICNGKLSELYHSSSTTSAIFWIFFFGIIFGIAIICFIFQKQIIKFVYYRIISQQENDNDEYNFFQYSSLKEEDTISASVTVY
uniref:Uncharacterized protein n=1 Tax=Panagrolaimus davidi TaxID=227884 RepID=A0A914PA67_9BILA